MQPYFCKKFRKINFGTTIPNEIQKESYFITISRDQISEIKLKLKKQLPEKLILYKTKKVLNSWEIVYAVCYISNMKTVYSQFPPDQFPPNQFPPDKFPPESIPTRSIPTRINSHPNRFPPESIPSRINSQPN